MSNLSKQSQGFVEPNSPVGEETFLDAIKRGEHVKFSAEELNEIGYLIASGKASRLLAYAWATMGFLMALGERHSPFYEGVDGESWKARLDFAEDSCLMLDRYCDHFKHYPSIAYSFDRLGSIYRQRIMLASPTLVGAAAEEHKSRESSTVWTYFIRHPRTDLIKIGKSMNPEDRLAQLECGAGAKLYLLGKVSGDREKELHEKFAHLHQYGEWLEDRNGVISKLAVFLEESSNE